MEDTGKIVKRCGCGREYTATQFAALKQVGDQPSADDQGSYVLHLANCTCGSTIGVEEKISAEDQHEVDCTRCGDTIATSEPTTAAFVCDACLGVES